MTMKPAVIAAWRDVLSGRLMNLESNRTAAQSGTRVDGEHRPSNRGERAAVTSQGYLALGLAERAVATQGHLESLENMGDDPRTEVTVGALLILSFDAGPHQRFVVLPGGDATELEIHGHTVTVLSTQSPLAYQLQDAGEGEVFEVELGPKVIEVELISIV
jgi:transcription elongation GreA/GreB family factor